MSSDERRWTFGEIVDVLDRSQFRPDVDLPPEVRDHDVGWRERGLTSNEVLSCAWPLAQGRDAHARLVWMTSGDGTDGEGHSFGWLMKFVLPNLRAEALFDLRESARTGPPTLILRERLRPVDPQALHGALCTDEDTLDADTLLSAADRRLARPPLPYDLLDSTVIMELFYWNGADLSGGGDLSLSVQVEEGVVRWTLTDAAQQDFELST